MFGGILEFYDFIIFVFFISIIVKYFFLLIGFLVDKIKLYKVCMVFSVVFVFFGFLFFKEFYFNALSLVNIIVLYFLVCFCVGIMNFCFIFMSDVFSVKICFSGIFFVYNIVYVIIVGFIL